MTTLHEKRKFCVGCRDDYYNTLDDSGARTPAMNGSHCWNLPKAKIVTRYRLHWWTSPVAPGAYRKVKTLSCWYSPGNWAMHESPHPDAVGVRDEVKS